MRQIRDLGDVERLRLSWGLWALLGVGAVVWVLAAVGAISLIR